jgi:CRP-like cAMP-binding protein
MDPGQTPKDRLCIGNNDHDELSSFATLARQISISCVVPGAEKNWRPFVNSSQANYAPIDEAQETSANPLSLWKDLTPRFLEGLTRSGVREVLSAATERRVPAKRVVTEQDRRADHMFLLTAGRARHFFVSEAGRKHILLWLPPGEIFGMGTLLAKPSNYIVSTETVQASTMLVWSRATIRSLAKRYPKLLENALSVASDYLRMYVATHIALTSNTARQRLVRVLANLASGFGRKVAAGIELDVTNEDLAYAANVTHFTASRLLSEWSRSGILVKERGKVLLRSPELLFRESA